MSKTLSNSALPPYEADGKRMPEDVWKFKRLQNWMTAMKLKIEGLSATDIAAHMNCSLRSAYQYLTLGAKAIQAGEITDDQILALGQVSDPVHIQRRRLLQRLKKSDAVIGQAMDDYHRDDKYARNATKTALAINKGLGVLVDTQLVGVGEIDVLAKRREDQQARLEAMKQFGLKVEAEVVDSDDSPMSVKRETGGDN